MTQQQSEIWTFPTNPDEFSQDERISFARLESKYIAELEDGTEIEYDTELVRWLPVVDEALIRQQQEGYRIPGIEDEPAPAQSGRKRMKMTDGGTDREPQEGNKSRKKANPKHEIAPRQNTAVYVTGLPPDATVEEVHELFSRKCGVIAEEIDSGRPRIKLYTNSDGKFKGDALVVFFKPQSVEMAIMLLDDTDFRFSPSGLSMGRMRVQAADSSYKKTNYAECGDGSGAAKSGSGTDKASSSVPRRSDQDKAKIIKKTQKLSAKLADWDDDDPASLLTDVRPGKAERMVILEHMFTLDELDEDPAALLEIKEDVRDECEKLGGVTSVVLYDQEEDGIMTVKFHTVEAARQCVQLMHGRAFGGRTVNAYLPTGREKFRKSKKAGSDGEDD